MDVLSQLLSAVEVRGSVFCHGPVGAPWAFTGGAEGRCLFHVVVEGSAWLARPGAEPTRVAAGDVILLPRGGRHRMGSEAEGDSVPLGDAVGPAEPFARFETGGDGARTHLICGSFVVDGMDWHPLLRALPDTLVVNAGVGRWLQPTLTALERHLEEGEPGAALITQRLAEVLFVQAIATWLGAQELPAGWLRALRDPQVGRAIGLLHAAPAQRWTAESLGRAVGLSRSALYARFRELVGEPPAAYLTRWRMTLAARMLAREHPPVAEVSERVGYASLPSFTSAFRRHHGVTPAAYRRAAPALPSQS